MSGPGAAPSAISVVVAEDQALLRASLAALVGAEADLTVVGAAADGREAVETVRRTRPDVVLMDLRMPVMDGQSATRAIRALERRDAPRVPIIAMTADAFEESIREAKQAGMTGYVTKPVESAKLYRTLAQLIYGA